MKTSEERRKKMREYYERTRDERKAYDRRRYAENKEKRQAYVRAWRAANPDKVKKSIRSWVDKNREKKYNLCKMRHSRFKQSMPKWLTQAQKSEILDMYKNCPEGYQVDHIVPINGKNVRGLHVPWNLQYLTASENSRKGNKCE